ncbi:hypothetical protein LINPERHAP2_LOCUS29991 [Linum perenne]
MEFLTKPSDGSEADDEDLDFDVPTDELNDDSSTIQLCDSDDDIQTEALNASTLPSCALDQTDVNRIQSPLSSYRASSQSNHYCDDKVNRDEVSSLAGEAFYDPRCDHKLLVLKLKLRFTSLQQFMDAVVNHCIEVGPDIKWVHNSNKNKEAVCAELTYNWRVYASWFGDKEAFVIESMGQPHTYGPTMYMKGADVTLFSAF